MAFALPLVSDEFEFGPAPCDVAVLDYQNDSVPFDRIRCPDLRKIGQMWRDLPRFGCVLPDWSVFDPFSITDVLDKLSVLQVGDLNRDEIEFTLYGSHMTATVGHGRRVSMQAMRFDTNHTANYYDIRDRVARAIDHSAPQYVRKVLSWIDRDSIEYETLTLPFQPDPDGTRRLLVPASTCWRLASL